MTPIHQPVMTAQVLECLAPRHGGCYVDGTLGEGGHSRALLAALGNEGSAMVDSAARASGVFDPTACAAPTSGQVIGLDRDPAMLARATARIGAVPGFRAVRARFSYLREALAGLGIERVDGILLDLGLCSAQLDDGARGFAFLQSQRGAPLDMRMDATRGESAAELLARVDAKQLADLLHAGGVPGPRRAAEILLRRAPLRTVGDLLDAVHELRLPARRHHPATLVFQALRMAVNDEIAELEIGLAAARDALAPGGRLVVLSYHSGEDRRVKQFFAREARGCVCPPSLPVCGCGRTPSFRIVCAGIGPDAAEIAANPRARSARLRAGERT